MARAVEANEASASGEIGKLKQAVQAVANMVSQNAEEDEKTAAALNARIDGIERRTASAQAAAVAAQETSGAAQKAIQNVATLVTQNSEEDEKTAAELNARIDGIERRVATASKEGGGGGGGGSGASSEASSTPHAASSPRGARLLDQEVARVLG